MSLANSTTRIVWETTPFIILYAILELPAGGFLSGIVSEAAFVPGLLILVPGMMGLRGNISSALAARLCSGMHLGYIPRDRFSPQMFSNIRISVVLSFVISFLLALFAWILCSFTSPSCMSLLKFAVISISTGVLSGLAMSLITASIAIWSCRHGLDPNNVTMPSSASIGDLMTILFLLIVVKMVGGLVI